jgi:iron complex outermembrane receptor protein
MYSRIDAKYTEFMVLGPVNGVNQLVNVADQRVFQNTPKNSANLRANYDFPLALGGNAGRVTLIGSASYKDDTSQFEFASALDQKAYSIYDASIIWTSANSKLRYSIHGKNLNDVHYKTGGYVFPTLGAEGTLTAFYGAPRTVSASIEYRF